MNLNHLIKSVLEDNESLCLDSEDDRRYLTNELYLHVKHYTEEAIEQVEKVIK